MLLLNNLNEMIHCLKIMEMHYQYVEDLFYFHHAQQPSIIKDISKMVFMPFKMMHHDMEL